MSFLKRIPLFIIAALLVGIKTYVVYRFYFGLSMETSFQEIILFINAIAVSMLIFFIAVWLKPKSQKRFIIITSVVLSTIVLANLMYYRNFTDFVTVPTLFQFNNAGDLGSSVGSLIYFSDLLLLLDVILVIAFTKMNWFRVETFSSMFRRRIIVISFAAIMINITLAEIERPMLFKRGFDREYLVKNVGLFTFHAYDAIITASTQSKRLFADGSEMDEIDEYVDENVREREEAIDLTGVAEDKNIIYVALESVQSFVIDEELNGEEITPFLNDLIEDSYYFENFYHQTLLGKTSDHEFLLDNGLYPLPNSAVFFTHAQNEFNALPEILKENRDYNSYALHANNGSFWNRNVMYETLGYDEFYDIESYDFDETDEIGWGLNDKKFFDQSVDMLKDAEEPFYSKLITLTNHFPFEMPQEEATIDQYDSSSVTLNQYFQTVKYTDEAVEGFFDRLKEEGLYEDSIIILMGDHYGISSYHNESMGNFLGKEITPYEEVKLQRVPMIVHIPGHEGSGTLSRISGQIDFKPTILNMMDIENENDIVFGNGLFAEERKPFVALRDGRFVGEDYIYSGGNCYDDSTGELTDESSCNELVEQAEQELNYSDEIIYGDLFRFYDFEDGEVVQD
ncbi:LTA synthase family protein [Halalkalibacillus halophilus]|uniref:LTA synthase family protein n=1 Tax=Halalkalibacillus halophilus TaxID=392827 RepID=UPI0003F675A8|nr:LTA synthase family protein [Halalkalibacillus halophilus]